MSVIRVGIAGLGRMGAMHAQNIAAGIPWAKITAACSIVPAELEFAKDALGVRDVFEDFDQMLEKADIDAVVIVTSTSLHAPQAIKALKAGKHVFVEKPMGVDVSECLQIEEIVRQNPDQVFMMGFMRRYDPPMSMRKRRLRRAASASRIWSRPRVSTRSPPCPRCWKWRSTAAACSWPWACTTWI